MDVVDEIKDRIDVVDLIGESVKLRKSGKNYTGFCPFHPNTRTPAFVVFPESGTWRCFGACNEGGDIFKFVMKKEGWDFPEALRHLAQRAGVELRPRRPEQEAAEEAHQRLRDALEAALVFYRHSLLETAPGAQVHEYLNGRGLHDETLEQFEIGYAPQSWDATLSYLREKGFSEQEQLEAGLLSEREGGGYHDRFRHRIMIPIRDARGRMAGFGARVVNPSDVPKFLNSPQTPVFDKGRLLYGLDKARKAIRQAGQAVIVEGYLDVIALHQAGYANVVSPMGTALSEDQLRLLKRFARRMVLALDPDAAGDQATLRGLSLAREALERQADPVFDARGLVRYEGRLDADIRVVTLPPDQDPDQVVAQDAAVWARMVEAAQPVVAYVLDVLTRGRDLDDAKVKSEVARQVLPLIEDVADPVERDTYRQMLARRLKVDERTLQGWRPTAAAARRSRRAAKAALPAEPARPSRDAARQERFCLGVLLRDPEVLYRVDRQLHSLGLERLSAQDFTGTERQVIFHTIRAALAQDEDEPAQHWRHHLDDPVLGTALALEVEVGALAPNDPRVAEEIVAGFLRLRMRNLAAIRSQVQFQQLTAQEQGDLQAALELNREVMRLSQDWARLDRALAGRRASVPIGMADERR
ncbi:MAG: DNA primase [Chloroflexota bacterium]